MNFGPGTYGLGLIAGALSTLSPCVLPLVPVLVAGAVNAHRWGALALGLGLALSFTIVGVFLATVGASLGLDPDASLAFVIDNCSISRVDRIERNGIWRVATVNHRPWLGTAVWEAGSKSLA